MEIVRSETLEPIVFDFDTAVSDEKLREHKGATLFVMGKCHFGDDLKDAVALSHGIDEEGRLDMDMYQAAQLADEYLRGRQGQPVVLADQIIKEGQLVRVDALAGVLRDTEKLVGIMDSRHNRHGGIALQGLCYSLSAYAVYGPLRLERIIPYDPNEESNDLPFSTPNMRLGHPENENTSESYTYKQDLLAGYDIMDWVERVVPDTSGRYELFIGLLKAIRTKEAQEYIMREPYGDILIEEQQLLGRISRRLTHAYARVSLHERAIAGQYAEASLEIAEMVEHTNVPKNRLPFTSGQRQAVDSEVASQSDIKDRNHVIERSQQFLSGLVI